MNIGLCPLVYNKIKLNLSHEKKTCMRDYMSQEEPMSSETATQYVLISTRYISQFHFSRQKNVINMHFSVQILLTS
jgi:hypothetical protein